MSRIVPTTPDNDLTPSYSSVPSSNGFSAGDLVYYKDSNFGVIPATAVTTGNFPISASAATGSQLNNATVQSPWTGNDAGGGNNIRAEIAATLTNGNIVVVMAQNNPGSAFTYFKIIDQNGAQVVAKTAVTTTYTAYSRGSVTVCALTGGGFVVAFCTADSSNFIRYRVYDNSGTAVTALLSDSSTFAQAYNFTMTGLPNGGFVIAANTVNNGTGLCTCVYSSTGVAGTSVTSIGIGGNSAYIPIVRARSDNSFYVLCAFNSNQLNMYRYTTSGGYVGNYTAAGDWYSSSQYAMDILANDTFAIVYSESGTGSYYAYGRIFNPTTNTITSSTYTNGSQSYSLIYEIKAIPSGGFILISNNAPTYGGLSIYKLDNTFGTILSQVSYAIPAMTNNYAYTKITTLIGATYYTVMWNGNTNSSYSFGSAPYIQMLPSDFSFRKFNTSTVTVSTASAAVNGYARAASTPNSASFLAETTQSISATQPATTGSTFTLTPYSPFSDGIAWQSMCKMTDGRFVIAYTTNGGTVPKFAVFNTDGTLYSTTTIPGSSSGQGLIRCICLGNGKLVITYANSSDDIIINIYSSTYSLLVTRSSQSQHGYVASQPGYYYSGAGHGLAPLNNDAFVIGIYSSSYGNIYLLSFSDAGTYINAAATGASSTWYNVQVYSNNSGSIAMRAYYQSGGVGYTWQFTKGTSGTNTITYTGVSYYNNYVNTDQYNAGGAVGPNGVFYGLINYGGNAYLERSYNGTGQQTLNVPMAIPSNCIGDVAIGTDGVAYGLIMPGNNSSSNYVQSYSASMTQSPYGGTPVAVTTLTFTATDKFTGGGNGPCARMVCLYDNTFAFSYITNNSSTLKVGILNVAASTYSTTITAGTSVSQPALYPSPANGYYLSGVAASDCTAGAVGVIQTNGSTTLNSQYPSTTASQAFDFTTNTLSGVKGTIAGRNVVLKGS